MADTFTKIATVTVGAGGASSIDFTSIPSTYTDLCLKLSARTGNAYFRDTLKVSFNGVTTNLSDKELGSQGTSGSIYSSSSASFIASNQTGATATANTFGNLEIYIPNYAGSAYKSVSIDGVTENNATDAFAGFTAGLWSSTSAIASIKLTPDTAYSQYSSATLYGIKNS